MSLGNGDASWYSNHPLHHQYRVSLSCVSIQKKREGIHDDLATICQQLEIFVYFFMCSTCRVDRDENNKGTNVWRLIFLVSGPYFRPHQTLNFGRSRVQLRSVVGKREKEKKKKKTYEMTYELSRRSGPVIDV